MAGCNEAGWPSAKWRLALAGKSDGNRAAESWQYHEAETACNHIEENRIQKAKRHLMPMASRNGWLMQWLAYLAWPALISSLAEESSVSANLRPERSCKLVMAD